jgi:hypothetical protein
MIAFDVTSYPLNNNEWSFPVCEVVHIIAFAFSIGTVAIVDLRLLGWGLKHQTSSQLIKDTAPWTLWGLVVMLISGPMIFFSDPNMYLHNHSFRFKISTLLLAILFNYTIHRKAALADATFSDAKMPDLLLAVLGAAIGTAGAFAVDFLTESMWFGFSAPLAIGFVLLVIFAVALLGRFLPAGAWGRLAGGLSMALWLSVVAGGLFIAFV